MHKHWLWRQAWPSLWFDINGRNTFPMTFDMISRWWWLVKWWGLGCLNSFDSLWQWVWHSCEDVFDSLLKCNRMLCMNKTTTRSAKRLASSCGSHGRSHHPRTNWSHNGNDNHDNTATFDQRTRTTTMRTTNNDVKYNFEAQTQWLIYTHIYIF